MVVPQIDHLTGIVRLADIAPFSTETFDRAWATCVIQWNLGKHR
jgi:hypothetical protein